MAEQHEVETVAGWNAAYVDNVTGGSLWNDSPIPAVEVAIDALKLAKCRTVLDVGCGDGRNLLPLVLSGFSVSGVDIAPMGLAKAADLVRGAAFLIVDDATKLSSLPDRSVDAITCFDMFGQIDDSAGLLSTFRRVLKPGGILALNAFTTRDSEYGLGERIGQHAFVYKDTLFKFFEEEDLALLFNANWDLLRLEEMTWVDPPHGDFRPYEHTHSNYVVIARVQ